MLSYVLCALTAKAQVHMCGNVIDISNNNPISFAHVSLLMESDSTIYKGTITDLNGEYQFRDVEIGRYLIHISYVGYEEYIELIRVVMPSGGNQYLKNITLRENVIEITSASINGNRITQYVDHQDYIFTDTQKSMALYAKDLIKGLPSYYEDSVTGRIKSIQGIEPVILINGIKASEIELRSIPPNKVKRVEHYDIPPARFATAGNVINVITSRLDNGISAGGQTLTGVKTGFSNDMAYLSCTLGDHRLDFSYQLEYRNYTHREVDINYEYAIDTEYYRDWTKGKEAFGYTNHNAFLKYAYLKPKQILQLTVSPVLKRDHNNGLYSALYQVNSLTNERERKLSEKNNTIYPSVDLYYWFQTKSGAEWIFNIHSTLFYTKGEQRRYESDLKTMEAIYTDEMFLNNNKYSTIAETIYSKNNSFGTLNFGYKCEYSHLKSDISNLYGASYYTSDYLRQYAYGELSGTQQKLLYRLSIGFMHLYNRSFSNTYNQVLFTPKIIAGYNFTQFTSIRFGLSAEPIVPDINMLSNNVVRLTPDILSKGNPDLRNGSTAALVLLCTHNNRYLDISTGIMASYANKPIEQSFLFDEDKYILTFNNGKYAYYIGGQLNIILKPFGTDVFSVGAYAKPNWQIIHTGDVINKVFSIENLLRTSFTYKGLTIDYQYSIPTLVHNGAFLSLTENTNNLTINYRYKQWRFKVGTLFMGSSSHYKTQSLGRSLVGYCNDRRIYDNKNMLVLGAEFNFLSGNNKKIERKISNNDVIAPIY